ncbi:MAG: DMT family transporter [Pseudomonadota bacterium]
MAVSPPPSAADNLRGGVWMLFSVVNASAMTVAARWVSEGMDSRMIVFLRAVLTLVAAAPLLASPAVRARLSFSRPWLHLLRGGLIGVSTQFGFHAIANLPLATVTVLFFTAPIFATLLAVPINGERVGPRRLAAVLTGFLGALVLLRPGVGGVAPDQLWAMIGALVSSLMFALALALSRGLAEADGAASAFVSSVAATVLVSAPLALPVWSLPADPLAWTALIVLIASGSARGFADIEAYRLGEASVVGVIAYLRLVLIGAAGWLLFAETPDAATWAGGAIIIGATLYIARRERQLRAATRPRKTCAAPSPAAGAAGHRKG